MSKHTNDEENLSWIHKAKVGKTPWHKNLPAGLDSSFMPKRLLQTHKVRTTSVGRIVSFSITLSSKSKQNGLHIQCFWDNVGIELKITGTSFGLVRSYSLSGLMFKSKLSAFWDLRLSSIFSFLACKTCFGNCLQKTNIKKIWRKEKMTI